MATASTFRFVFTGVRVPGSELQLQEVRLYGTDGTRIDGLTASNPGGSWPSPQPPSDAVDSDLGLLDACNPTCCTYLAAPCTAHNNEHVTLGRPACGCGEDGEAACTCSRGSKWLDFNMAVPSVAGAYSSTLQLSLVAAQTVASYELITADDNSKRDPTAWTFSALLDGARRARSRRASR